MVEREIETSVRPSRMKESASLARKVGSTKSGRSVNSRSRSSWKAERRKNQFSCSSLVRGISWIGQVSSGPASEDDLKSAQRGQNQPS